MKQSFRKHLSMPGLLKSVGTSFAALPDERRTRSITLKDGLLSALAVFHQKVPSLLQCEVMMRNQGDTTHASNLRTLSWKRQPPIGYLYARALG